MDLSKLMQTSPENLAQLQYDELKAFAIKRLENILDHFKQENFKIIKDEFLFDSPAGDGYGLDNKCIDFTYDYDRTGYLDIYEIIERLEGLKSVVNKNKKTK